MRAALAVAVFALAAPVWAQAPAPQPPAPNQPPPPTEGQPADQTNENETQPVESGQVRTTPPVFNGTTIQLSFAYGAFELKAGDNPETAMARADEAMYRHKRGVR